MIRGFLENRSSLAPSRNGLWALVTGASSGTAAGVAVNEGNALSLSAVFACVRVLSESVASLPLLTYERTAAGKHRAHAHPLYELLKEQPNPEMTAFELRETLIAHVCTWGNAYCEIDWTSSGQVRALWPLRPDRVTVLRVGGELVYDVEIPGEGIKRLPRWRIHHLRGMGNGVVGYSPVRLHAETLGYSFATKTYGARFFGNGARPGVVLQHPGQLSQPAYERMLDSWSAAHEGLENAHRTRILEEGMTIETIGVPPEEAQFLETQKFQVVDIARIFRMQPHMIQALDNATFSNIEHQAIEFVTHTLRPWLVRSEQALQRDLLVGDERERYFIEYLVDGLLRGDVASRYTAYQVGRQGGWLSVNDVRELENLNPIDGGDVYLQPLNMVEAGESAVRGAVHDAPFMPPFVARSPEVDTPPHAPMNGERTCTCGACTGAGGERSTSPADPVATAEIPQSVDRRAEQVRDDRQALGRTYVRLMEDATGRLVRREVADLGRAIDKYLRRDPVDWDGFRNWLQSFYEDLRGVAPSYFKAVMDAAAEQVARGVAAELDEPVAADGLAGFVEDYLDTYARGYTASHHQQLIALMRDEPEPVEAVATRVARWGETESQQQALSQGFEAVNALAIAAYGVVGIRYLMWQTAGDSCPFCRGLAGRVIGIDAYFVNAGDTLGSGEQTMTISRNKRHGPIHNGCDCVVVAVRQ